MSNTVILKDDNLINILQIFKDLHDTCTLFFKTDAVYAKFMDKNLVSVTEMKLDCYEKNKLKEETEISFNIEEILKIFSCKKRDSKINLLFKKDKIFIKFVEDNKKYEKYTLKLVNTEDTNDFESISINSNYKIQMFSDNLTKICKKISKFDDTMVLKAKQQSKVLFQTQNEDVEIYHGDHDDNHIIISEDLEMKLMLKYLNIFTKCDKMSDIVILNIENEEMPIEMIYNFDDSHIKFYLCPQND